MLNISILFSLKKLKIVFRLIPLFACTDKVESSIFIILKLSLEGISNYLSFKSKINVSISTSLKKEFISEFLTIFP